jgi:hypothetical protein
VSSKADDQTGVRMVETEIDDTGLVTAWLDLDDGNPPLETVAETEADAGFQLGILFALAHPERIHVHDSDDGGAAVEVGEPDGDLPDYD